VPDPIEIVPSDPDWPVQFELIKDRVSAALGDLAVAIEHVGSTSVPGLSAKPIIDIDVAVAREPDIPVAIELLATLGYRHRGDLGIPGREAFSTPDGAYPHHLYLVTVDAAEFQRHIAFRDRLRADAAVAKAYGSLKSALAKKHRDNREAYTNAKSGFVNHVLDAISCSAPSVDLTPIYESLKDLDIDINV
jgi:GrpB-like predicted nucleotidyltransferase (UPF0157 family)